MTNKITPVADKKKSVKKKKKANRRVKPFAKVNLFSVNPETSKPYLEIEHAQALTIHHVQAYMPFLLNIHSMEDIVQSMLLFMVQSEYNPKKSAPKTWAITIIKSRTGHMMITATRDRRSYESDDINLKTGKPYRKPIIPISGNITSNNGEDSVNVMDLMPDNINPEDKLLAQEFIDEISAIPESKRLAFLKERGFGRYYKMLVGEEPNEFDSIVGRGKSE